MTVEASLEALFRRLVTGRGGSVMKIDASSNAGAPDRLVVIGGRMYLVELKTQTGRLSTVQEVFHDRLRRRTGVEVSVLYGADQVRDWVDRVHPA